MAFLSSATSTQTALLSSRLRGNLTQTVQTEDVAALGEPDPYYPQGFQFMIEI
jgi:hypothetical protein